jgi:hypothetical protein
MPGRYACRADHICLLSAEIKKPQPPRFRGVRLGLLSVCREYYFKAAADARYKRSAKGKAANARYKRSTKGKVANARYRRSAKGRKTSVRYEARRRRTKTSR